MKRLIYTLVFLTLIQVIADSDSGSFAGIELGMTNTELKEIRPNATLRSSSFIDKEGDEYAERISFPKSEIAYYFKGSKLEAVFIISKTKLPAVTVILDDFQEMTEKVEILRMTKTAETYVTLATKFIDISKGFEAYRVNDEHEDSLVIFNPKVYGFDKFFIKSAAKEDIDKRIKQSLGNPSPKEQLKQFVENKKAPAPVSTQSTSSPHPPAPAQIEKVEVAPAPIHSEPIPSTPTPKPAPTPEVKEENNTILYIVIGLLLAAVGFAVIRKKK